MTNHFNGPRRRAHQLCASLAQGYRPRQTRTCAAAEAAGAEAVQAFHRRARCGTTATVKVVRTNRKVLVDIATALMLHAQRPAGTGVLSLRKQVAA